MNGIRPMIKELFSSVSEPMLVVNINGEVEYLNKNAKEILSIPENMIRNLEMDENSKPSWTSFLSKIREQKFGTCILNLKLSDCKYKKVQLEGYLYKKKKLIVVRIMNLLVNTQKELKERFSTYLLDALSHGVVITNFDGVILDINKKALQFIQCDYDEIVNESHELVFDKLEDFEFKKLKYYEELKNIGQASLVLRNVNNNKEQYYKIESKLNLRENIIISTITDVTLQFELNNQLKQMDNTKEICQIAATIAHEIRNPMTSLKGFIELIRNSQLSSNEYIRYLNVMESELNRIDNYLEEMLHTTKPLKTSELVYLTEIVEDVVELMQVHATKKNIIIAVENGEHTRNASIIGSKNRLKQILINLIKNAIEAMDKGGFITVCLKNINNEILQLSVQDEGFGISKEDIDKLFKPFYTTKEHGTGIGLPIVKKIIEEHNGNIRVESGLNSGTTFIIDFPISNLDSKLIKETEKIWYTKSLNSLPI